MDFCSPLPPSSTTLISFMASPNPNNVSSPSSHPNLPTNTTFVQADPSTFRAVVQRLTGVPHDHPFPHKLPVTLPARLSGKPLPADIGPRRSAFKLHERRQSARKLEIKLNHGGASAPLGSPPSITMQQRSFLGFGGGCGGGEMVMVSPVSPLDLFARGSPRTPLSSSSSSLTLEEEERAIAEKGFYLHPSPLSTPRGSEPELLPLFPLHSPRHDSSSSS
ncbi:hypothetical protein U1Q18_006771 [Sarracenia purpurea var. burkii]